MFHAADDAWTRVEFANNMDRAREVAEEILNQCAQHRFEEAEIFAVKMALEEALVNAVKHGNRLDPAKKVRVNFHVTELRVDISIEDEGYGFQHAEIPNPTDDEHLELPSGRGILLMRAYMSSVVFNPRGNKVTQGTPSRVAPHRQVPEVFFRSAGW